MNWNAVIKSLEKEAATIAWWLENNKNTLIDKPTQILKMELCVILAKALAEGMEGSKALEEYSKLNSCRQD